MPGPALQGLIALIIYLVVFILACGQALVTHLNVPAVGQVEVDPNFYIWAWRWWTYAVSHGLNPLYSYQIGAPGGYSLAWATTSPTVALLVAPLTAAFGPVVSFNLTLVLAPPASAWAAFVAARRLTGRFWAALPAGVVFGFNVYTLDHEVSGQPNLTVTLLLPLTVYLVLLWWDGTLRRTGYVIWMMIAIALQFYAFIEYFAELSLMWVAALALGFGMAGRELRPRVARLARHTGIAYLGAMALAAPYLIYALGNVPSALTRPEPFFSLDLSALVLPRHDRLLGMTWWAAAAAHDISATTYVGIPLLVIPAALAIFCWSRRVIRFLVIGFVIVVLLAAGPNLIIDGQSLLAAVGRDVGLAVPAQRGAHQAHPLRLPGAGAGPRALARGGGQELAGARGALGHRRGRGRGDLRRPAHVRGGGHPAAAQAVDAGDTVPAADECAARLLQRRPVPALPDPG
jgi:hypothetical protein